MCGGNWFKLWNREGKQVRGHPRRRVETSIHPLLVDDDVSGWDGGKKKEGCVLFIWSCDETSHRDVVTGVFVLFHLMRVSFPEPWSLACGWWWRETQPSSPARRNKETMTWQTLAPDWWAARNLWTQIRTVSSPSASCTEGTQEEEEGGNPPW